MLMITSSETIQQFLKKDFNLQKPFGLYDLSINMSALEALSHLNRAALFSYKLRYIEGFWLVEMTILTNQKPTIYRNLYENTGPVAYCLSHLLNI